MESFQESQLLAVLLLRGLLPPSSALPEDACVHVHVHAHVQVHARSWDPFVAALFTFIHLPSPFRAAQFHIWRREADTPFCCVGPSSCPACVAPNYSLHFRCHPSGKMISSQAWSDHLHSGRDPRSGPESKLIDSGWCRIQACPRKTPGLGSWKPLQNTMVPA